jgi:hypothetical protein
MVIFFQIHTFSGCFHVLNVVILTNMPSVVLIPSKYHFLPTIVSKSNDLKYTIYRSKYNLISENIEVILPFQRLLAFFNYLHQPFLFYMSICNIFTYISDERMNKSLLKILC